MTASAALHLAKYLENEKKLKNKRAARADNRMRFIGVAFRREPPITERWPEQ